MLTARLLGKVSRDAAKGCWLFTGSVTSNGYGRVWDGQRSDWAHRVFYRCAVGPIPEGMEIDHLCRNTRCVNPEHLEPVTSKENYRRSTNAQVTRRRHKEQAFCKRSHPLFGDNVRRDRRGSRVCIACSLIHAAAYRAKTRRPNTVMRPVVTPVGRFESASVAARALGISTSLATWRARNNRVGWSYAADVLLEIANQTEATNG